jgi:acetyltransferase-like isoleucine patch superfamily enzyme
VHAAYEIAENQVRCQCVQVILSCSKAPLDSGWTPRTGFYRGMGEGELGSRSPITIGNDVWTGRDALVLDGVTIADGAVVAARAVVT